MATRKIMMALLLAAAPALAQSGLTGTWSGTYTASITLSGCQNKTSTWSGTANVALLQAGASLTGRLDLTNFTFFNSCNTSSGELTRTVFGTTDGSAISLAVPNDPAGWQLTGNASGSTIALQLSDPQGLTASFNLAPPPTAVPLGNFTGTWSGPYNFTDVCPNGSTKKTYSGNFTLGLTQDAQRAGGVVTMTNVPLYDQNCSTIANLTQMLTVAGSVSGTTFTGAAYDPSGLFDFPITATLGGTSISGNVSGASPTSTSGTFNLTQASPQTPASDFSGHYEGSYAESDNGLATCFNVGTVNFQGAASVDLVQSGNAVNGALVLEDTLAIVSDGFGNCVVLPGGEEVLPFYGTINNGAVTLSLPQQQFSFTLSGDSISGTMHDSAGDVMQFSTTRTTVPNRSRRRAVRP